MIYQSFKQVCSPIHDHIHLISLKQLLMHENAICDPPAATCLCSSPCCQCRRLRTLSYSIWRNYKTDFATYFKQSASGHLKANTAVNNWLASGFTTYYSHNVAHNHGYIYCNDFLRYSRIFCILLLCTILIICVISTKWTSKPFSPPWNSFTGIYLHFQCWPMYIKVSLEYSNWLHQCVSSILCANQLRHLITQKLP